MRYVKAQDGVVIQLGRQGENEVVTVQFDIKGWAEEYGTGTFTLVHQRCKDGDGFEREITVDGDVLSWLITNVDVAYAGNGVLQLTYTVGDAVAKSAMFYTKVLPSLDASEEVPDPWKPWVDEVLEARDDAEDAAENAAESEGNAAESERNASGYAEDAEAWARGKRGNVDVPSTDETYHNNSEWYARQSAASATAAAVSAESAGESETRARMYYGAPLTASTAAEMTDHNRVYVYVGSETGYINGNWYYWNGTAWTSGGVYNSNGEDVASNADIDSALYS